MFTTLINILNIGHFIFTILSLLLLSLQSGQKDVC